MSTKTMNLQPKKKISSDKKKAIVKKVIWSAIAIIICFTIIFPIIWMLPAAFKEKRELFVLDDISFFPRKWTFENFTKVFDVDVNGSKFMGAVFMTLLVALLATVGSLFVNMLAAYALARIDLKAKFVWPFYCSRCLFKDYHHAYFY